MLAIKILGTVPSVLETKLLEQNWIYSLCTPVVAFSLTENMYVAHRLILK